MGCPLGVDDENQLVRVQELQRQHGTAFLHWADYLGFRNTAELEEVARSFSDHYYGLYPSLEAFRQTYEMAPDEYVDQSYRMVEAEGGIYIFDR